MKIECTGMLAAGGVGRTTKGYGFHHIETLEDNGEKVDIKEGK